MEGQSRKDAPPRSEQPWTPCEKRQKRARGKGGRATDGRGCGTLNFWVILELSAVAAFQMTLPVVPTPKTPKPSKNGVKSGGRVCCVPCPGSLSHSLFGAGAPHPSFHRRMTSLGSLNLAGPIPSFAPSLLSLFPPSHSFHASSLKVAFTRFTLGGSVSEFSSSCLLDLEKQSHFRHFTSIRSLGFYKTCT
jgi:hypothetical protein